MTNGYIIEKLTRLCEEAAGEAEMDIDPINLLAEFCGYIINGRLITENIPMIKNEDEPDFTSIYEKLLEMAKATKAECESNEDE